MLDKIIDHYEALFDGYGPTDVESYIQAQELSAAEATAFREYATEVNQCCQMFDSALNETSFDVTEVSLAEESVFENFLLRREIGRGGMGVVYEAEQLRPVRREVAVKVMQKRPSRKYDDAMLRFELERQAIARMEHPGIAHLLDSGISQDGIPYLAMELIRDQLSITEYCKQHRLPIADRLKLFAAACRAVQHAHQKGAIHRDLTPDNVLVTEVDGQPTPKIIDFGLAWELGPPDETSDEVVAKTDIVGTYEYMSPEQARGDVDQLDVRTDVFGLGGVLCALLSGCHPIGLAHSRLRTEVLSTVRTASRSPPSQRFAEQTPQRQREWAEACQTTPQRLRRKLRLQLDDIVSTASSLDSTDRYQSVDALAVDVERVLRNEPVSVKRGDGWYVVRQAIVRNRVLLSLLTSALFITFLVSALVRESRTLAIEKQMMEDMHQTQLADFITIDMDAAGLPPTTETRETLLNFTNNLVEEAEKKESMRKSPLIVYRLVRNYEQLSQPELALETLRRFRPQIEIPDFWMALFALTEATLLCEIEDFDEAGELLTSLDVAALDFERGEGKLRFLLAELKIAAGDHQAGINMLEELLSESADQIRDADTNPSVLRWRRRLGGLLGGPNMGRLAEAEERLSKVVQVYASQPEAYPITDRALARFELAAAQLRLGISPRNPTFLKQAERNLAKCVEFDEYLFEDEPILLKARDWLTRVRKLNSPIKQ